MPVPSRLTNRPTGFFCLRNPAELDFFTQLLQMCWLCSKAELCFCATNQAELEKKDPFETGRIS